jgi:hypothetical protein
MIPDYQTLMLPVLKQSANGEVRINDVVETLAKELGCESAWGPDADRHAIALI